MGNDISGKKLIIILFYKIFTNDISAAIVNIFLPCLISIHCVNFDDSPNWWKYIYIFTFIIILFNAISVLLKNAKKREIKYIDLAYKCYNEQCAINNKFANNIFRLNKTINDIISNNKPISTKSLDKIADFQTFSFSICESIQHMLRNEFGDDIQCEVTIMKKSDAKIKMVAYANDDNRIPSSYSEYFNLNERDILFIRIFNDLDGEIVCKPNKKEIKASFKKLSGSIRREENICQYIGIPIKTNRNKIELLLQIDVSKEKIFGKNEKQMKLFAKNILYPYAVLLHKIYERDLIFKQYYDMISLMLSSE